MVDIVNGYGCSSGVLCCYAVGNDGHVSGGVWCEGDGIPACQQKGENIVVAGVYVFFVLLRTEDVVECKGVGISHKVEFEGGAVM